MSVKAVLDWLTDHTAILPTWARLTLTGLVGAGAAILYVLGYIQW